MPRIIEIGMGTMDQNKGVLIAYGHNLAAGAEAMIYAEENGLWDKVDIGGVCCTAHDLNRIGLGKGEAKVPAGIGTKPKVAGAIGWWRKMVRSGVMDCVMVDEQCVWCDVLGRLPRSARSPSLPPQIRSCWACRIRTNDSIDAIVDDLVSFKVPGVAILDPAKAGDCGHQDCHRRQAQACRGPYSEPDHRGAVPGRHKEVHTSATSAPSSARPT